ncbi:MAG TPA: helix-turn-helix domain-containing protein [Polyangia bacterium]
MTPAVDAAADDDLLSSAEAAALLGVSASTIKRWVDEGELAAERTAGGHRRIRRAALARLRERFQAPATVGAAGRLVDLLLENGPQQRIEARLLAMRGEGGSAVGVARAIAPALVELGQRWHDGRISVVQEHLASERLARALARLVEWTPLADGAPRALLTVASGDEHTLGLSLLELVLREAGWETLWAGRSAPTSDIARAIADPSQRIALVAISASIVSRDRRRLAREEEAIGRACARAGARCVVGGAGAWMERPRHSLLIRDFADADARFRQWRAR